MIARNWKFYLGIALFAYSWIPWIFVFLVLPLISLSAEHALSLAGVLLTSAEVAFLGSVALLGKPFIEFLTKKLKAVFLKSITDWPTAQISKPRYIVGLTLFLFSVFVPTVFLEVLLMLDAIDSFGHANALYVLLGCDALFVASFFILGGEFWDKFKKLFEWPGQVTST